MPARFDSVIFALDGTLWDASASITQAFQVAVASVDYIAHDIALAQVQAVTGQPYTVVYERLFPTMPADKLDEYRALCARQELAAAEQHGGAPYPELETSLAYLKAQGYRLFIVSNCQLGHYFEGHQCFGTRLLPKPVNIREVMAQYGLRALVYVGDTLGDLEASQKAGVPFIFAAYGFGRLSTAEAPNRIARSAGLRQLL